MITVDIEAPKSCSNCILHFKCKYYKDNENAKPFEPNCMIKYNMNEDEKKEKLNSISDNLSSSAYYISNLIDSDVVNKLQTLYLSKKAMIYEEAINKLNHLSPDKDSDDLLCDVQDILDDCNKKIEQVTVDKEDCYILLKIKDAYQFDQAFTSPKINNITVSINAYDPYAMPNDMGGMNRTRYFGLDKNDVVPFILF